MLEPKRLTKQEQAQLQELFPFNATRFMHPLFGFDICAFDEALGTPKGVSTEDHLTREYGQEATDLIKSLLSK